MTVLKRSIPLLTFTTGQRLRILRRMRQVAVALGERRLLPQIDRAIAHELTTQGFENLWAGGGGQSLYADEVRDLDAIVDQLLAGLRDVVQGHARGLPAHDPVAIMCDRFLTTVFPNGLAAIVSLPYVDQVAAVDVILGKLTGELDSEVRELGLEGKRDRLIELNAEYRRLIDAGRQEVRYPEVREARQRGLELLREIIAVVLGQFHDSKDPVQVEARETLLAPVMSQLDESTARNRALRRSRAAAAGDGEGDETDGSDGADELDDGDDGDALDDVDDIEDVDELDDVETATVAGA